MNSRRGNISCVGLEILSSILISPACQGENPCFSRFSGPRAANDCTGTYRTRMPPCAHPRRIRDEACFGWRDRSAERSLFVRRVRGTSKGAVFIRLETDVAVAIAPMPSAKEDRRMGVSRFWALYLSPTTNIRHGRPRGGHPSQQEKMGGRVKPGHDELGSEGDSPATAPSACRRRAGGARCRNRRGGPRQSPARAPSASRCRRDRTGREAGRSGRDRRSAPWSNASRDA